MTVASATASPGVALVTGATGYIGGELVPALLDRGWSVRTLTRSPVSLAGRDWAAQVAVVAGDATKPADLDRALAGVDVAYYLLHSMDGAGSFVERDATMARDFAAAATAAGVQRIIYLSGIHPAGDLSEHLASRVEVGQILLDSPVPTAVLQAAVVMGRGSASFDMLRYLTHRLPAMIAPRWLESRIQPIAIDDAIHYLMAAADLPAEVNRTFDIAGPDVLTYREMIQRFAAVTGLRRRLIVGVPVLTPWLASHWVGVVTPVSAGVAKPLVGSLVHDVVAAEHDLQDLAPPTGGPTGFDDAVHAAMEGAEPDTGPRNLALTAAAVSAAAVVGSVAAQPNSRWYRSLDLPSWQPPPRAFPIVWTSLYADIAATSAATLTTLDREGRAQVARAYRRALAVNLALNAGWNVVFFRAKRPLAAAIWSAALTASSADLTRRAAGTGAKRGRPMSAYAAWCGFATGLSAEIARRTQGTRRSHGP